MSVPLPDFIDPWRAVDAGSEFEGVLPLSNLSRLGGFLKEAEGQVQYRLACSRDTQGYGVLSGEVRARVVLTCQRCMGPLDWEIASPLALALVSGLDEARLLPEELDPLLVSREPIRLPDLIEDELLLALPQIAMHEPGDCSPPGGREEGGNGQEGAGEKVHPFAKLGDWRLGVKD